MASNLLCVADVVLVVASSACVLLIAVYNSNVVNSLKEAGEINPTRNQNYYKDWILRWFIFLSPQ